MAISMVSEINTGHTTRYTYLLPLHLRLDVTLGQLDERMQLLRLTLLEAGLATVAKPLFSFREGNSWVEVEVWRSGDETVLSASEGSKLLQARIAQIITHTLIPALVPLTVTM